MADEQELRDLGPDVDGSEPVDPDNPDPAHADTALETEDPQDTEPATEGDVESDSGDLPSEIPDASEEDFPEPDEEE